MTTTDPSTSSSSSSDLIAELNRLRLENAQLKQQLESQSNDNNDTTTDKKQKLSRHDVMRYSRHLLMPEIGVDGQLKLVNASVLVVGAGGLGAPSSLFLAAAGVGKIGILDYDVVEESNLQRQIIHDETRLNISKALSARITLNRLNSSVKIITHETLINSSNALEIINQYDIVLDCTDNVATRYLLNDACVLAGKVLVSGSALRMEGQLTVYNHSNGPCYRCLFPTPPPASTVTNCSDGGVLGAVPGVIGTLQALEAIKIITGHGDPLSQRMLLFDGNNTTFRTIRLRPKSPKCAVCSDNPTITQLIDYVQFCGSGANDKTKSLALLSAEERISCKEYHKTIQSRDIKHVLIDVRPTLQTDICHLPNAILIPYKELSTTRMEEFESICKGVFDDMNRDYKQELQVFVMCRRGNQSQRGVRLLQERGFARVKDIVGGVTAWANEVDMDFPIY